MKYFYHNTLENYFAQEQNKMERYRIVYKGKQTFILKELVEKSKDWNELSLLKKDLLKYNFNILIHIDNKKEYEQIKNIFNIENSKENSYPLVNVIYSINESSLINYDEYIKNNCFCISAVDIIEVNKSDIFYLLTEDKVEIFDKEQNIFILDTELDTDLHAFPEKACNIDSYQYIKVFSTEQAAKNYKKLNIKSLSVKDLYKYVKGFDESKLYIAKDTIEFIDYIENYYINNEIL